MPLASAIGPRVIVPTTRPPPNRPNGIDNPAPARPRLGVPATEAARLRPRLPVRRPLPQLRLPPALRRPPRPLQPAHEAPPARSRRRPGRCRRGAGGRPGRRPAPITVVRPRRPAPLLRPL